MNRMGEKYTIYTQFIYNLLLIVTSQLYTLFKQNYHDAKFSYD